MFAYGYHLNSLFMKKLLFLILFSFPLLCLSQTTFSWRNDQPGTASGGSWNNSNNWWNGNNAALPGGAEILYLDGNVGTTMTNNLPSTNRFKITFGSSNAASRTIGGSTANTFYDFGGTWPRIQNDAGVTHTINFPINASTDSGINFQLVSNVGPLVFGGTLNNNGRTIFIYGNNTTTDATNRFVRLSGVVSGSGVLNVSQFGTVKLAAANTYTGQTQIDNGELWIESTGSINTGSGIFVGNGGEAANVAKLWLSNAAGGNAFSNNITVNNGNPTTRVIGGLNTSGTHIFSGNITNNSANLNLSAFNAGGTTDFQGVVSGGNPVVIAGGGTVKLSGINTYTGTTTLSSGTLSIAANTALGSGSLTIGNAAVTNTLAITNDLTRSQGITVVDASTAGVIDVASGKNAVHTGTLSQTGSNQSTKIGKSGAGTLTLSGTNTYSGQIQIGQGTVIANNNSALGTNTSTNNRGIDLGLNVGDVSQPNNVSLLANNGFTVAQSVYVAPNTSSATRTIGLNGSGAATFSNAIFLGGILTLNAGSGILTVSGAMENAGGINVNGGTVIVSGDNTYTGSTTVTSGILRLGAANRIASASPIVLSGGTFSSGATAGFTDNLGTLNLTASSTIALGTGSHKLTFANSSALTWDAGATLTITGWAGNAGQSGTGGKIIVGSGGLTSAQLAKISFTGYSGTPIIVSGEVVPPAPVLAVTAGSLDHGSSCVGTAASTVTYTLSNTGGNANGIQVLSDNPEFVVSNVTTSVGANSSATYQVTFTPSASGSRTATITITTTTPNSNGPITSQLTGTGNSLPAASVSGTTTVCKASASPSVVFTGANGTPPYIFTYQINGGGSFTETSIGNTASVSVPTNTSGAFVYNLISVQDSSITGCSNAQTGSVTVTVDEGATYYADTDGDGFGAGDAIVSCTGQPANTVTNNTDCSPSDPLAWRLGDFYVDADNDTFFDGNPATTQQCYGNTTPTGYVSLSDNKGTDCDDTKGEVNSNHVEVLANGIDDNCDEVIDEVAPTTSLVATHCGSTLSNIANSLFANQVPSAQGYRFEISINGTNPRYYDSATNHFSLLNIPGGVLYNTTYTLRIAVKTNDFWRAYSTTCLVTTPAVPATTNIGPAQCGTTVASMSTTIFAVQVTAANQYRFEVSDGVSPARTYETSVNRFSFAALGGLSYNTTYSVRVALRFGSTWQDYGTACNVSTPVVPPASNVVPSQCGTTISNGWATIFAIQVPEATGYRFNVTAPGVSRFYDTPNNRFSLRNIPSFTVTPNTTYTITVQILYNGFYQTAGSACTITTAGVVTRQAETAVSVFDVKAYPNPYADTFKLDMNTSGEDTVEVKVYDMIGRQMEATILNVSDLDTKEIGYQYPSGVYNIIVTQGENVKTLRVIKR